ncbi:hypothetical protein Y032_0464g1941 [Ancylostoma ceylanicum]|uniref:Uncharacterized protein n=1 Tax=Ancylostoma ceylanicum TaxID=53326 RepID=A0A016WYL2_9BILA|nr:hypothetical protein Y032_0464g1941 [Ancylostoma ceylanicum]
MGYSNYSFIRAVRNNSYSNNSFVRWPEKTNIRKIRSFGRPKVANSKHSCFFSLWNNWHSHNDGVTVVIESHTHPNVLPQRLVETSDNSRKSPDEILICPEADLCTCK